MSPRVRALLVCVLVALLWLLDVAVALANLVWDTPAASPAG